MAPYFQSLIRILSFELISLEARTLQQTKNPIWKCVENFKNEKPKIENKYLDQNINMYNNP